jgi:hypothetical protein
LWRGGLIEPRRLLGIPVLNDPDGLLLASMNRTAEITLGVAGSGAISAQVMLCVRAPYLQGLFIAAKNILKLSPQMCLAASSAFAGRIPG